MRHPQSENWRWSIRWFCIYGAAYCFPLLVLTLALQDRDIPFIALSSCLTIAVALHAWISARKRVDILWRIGLVGVMLSGWAFTSLLVLAPSGNNPICYDLLVRAHVWGPLQNLGPDPSCKGVPIEAARRL
ncbi:MAG: hypothetical protein GW855_12795 [Erythrobacter sp.]|nr:hypothetical protein [Erythrobacter sp.]NCQ62379.1 hypothetical protein [Alphaproteobacteria bacterium]